MMDELSQWLDAQKRRPSAGPTWEDIQNSIRERAYQAELFLQRLGMSNLRGFGTATGASGGGFLPAILVDPSSNPDMQQMHDMMTSRLG